MKKNKIPSELEMRRSGDIHTCHVNCKKAICVLKRDRDQLKMQVEVVTEQRDLWAKQCNIATESLHDCQSKFSAMSLIADDHAMARLRNAVDRDHWRDRHEKLKTALQNLTKSNVIKSAEYITYSEAFLNAQEALSADSQAQTDGDMGRINTQKATKGD